MLCPLSSRVFPITVPPLRDLEGTHGDRVAGDNTQHSHRLLSFSFYVTRSRTKRIQTRPLACTVRQARRSLGSPPCGSCSVFEVAHTIYKCALNECSFIRLRALHATPSRQSCETVAGVFIPARTDSKDFLRGSDCENKRGRWQSPLCLRFYLGDSHVALLL